MRKWFKRFVCSVFLLVLLFTGFLYFVLSTQTGLETALHICQLFLPGKLQIHTMQGSVLNGFSIDSLNYSTKDKVLKIRELKGHWTNKSLKAPFLYTLHIQAKTMDLNKQNLFNHPEIILTAQGSLPHILLKTSSTINNQWQMNANLQGMVPWQWQFQGEVAPLDKTQKIYTSLKAEAWIENAHQGKATLIISPGEIKMTETPLAFKKGNFEMRLTHKGLAGKGRIELDQHIKLQSTFHLPQFDLSKGLLKDAPLSGQLDLLIPSLDFLKNSHPELSNMSGLLKAFIKVKGSLNKPIIESQIDLSKASVSLARMGLDLKANQLQVVCNNHHWKAYAKLNAANTILSIKGQGKLSKSLNGELDVEAQDFPIFNTAEYQIHASPQLKLKLRPSNIAITGSILIPYAKIKPQSLTNSLVLSDDVVYKKRQPQGPQLFKTSMNIQLKMGQDVDVSIKGLHAALDGGIQIKQEPLGPIMANGVLSVKKGEYKAFGQVLNIEKGQLIFTDNALTRPGINLRAYKTIKRDALADKKPNKDLNLKNDSMTNLNMSANTKVGVEVSGQLNSPKILLFSNPAAFSQADILSLILFDRLANQDSKGQLLLTALSSMNLGTGNNGAEMIEQLKKNLGFDIDVQTNPDLDPAQFRKSLRDNTTLVVGKSLTKNLYLSYNMGLSSANPNVLTLKYLLNQFFSIQMSNSSAGSGMDVLYNGTKDK